MDLMSGIPARFGRNSLSDYNPELQIGLRGLKGNVWFVNSAAASGGNGASWDGAVTTLMAAIALAQVNDLILIAPGHTETISAAAGVTVTKAGVQIIGLGSGTARPTFTMSAVASTFALSAANVRIENLLFLVSEDTTKIVDVNATDCQIVRCEFRSSTALTKEFVTAIDIGTGDSANAADRTQVIECIIVSTAAGASNGIELGAVNDRVAIVGCLIWGDYADAPIHNPTGNVLTRLFVLGNILENTQTGDHALELVSACTGILARNLYKSDMTQATAADPGSCFSYENYHDDVIDTSAIISPAVT